MAETINDRIENIINHQFDGNKAAFCKATGLVASGLASYIGRQRRSKPSIDMVIKIVNATKVDPWWLLTGEGEDGPSVGVTTHGDLSPASGTGDVQVNIGDTALATQLKVMEKLADERLERIEELRQHIRDLREKR